MHTDQRKVVQKFYDCMRVCGSDNYCNGAPIITLEGETYVVNVSLEVWFALHVSQRGGRVTVDGHRIEVQTLE